MRFRVDLDYDGMTVGEFLKSKRFSRRTINRLKSGGRIFLNGAIAYTGEVIKNGDILDIDFTEDCNIVPSPIPLDIIYEDEDILVLNKQPGIVVHPTAYHYDDTIGNGVMYYFSQKGLKRGFHPVNRLDRETSGVLIIALNQHMHNMIQQYGQMDKAYIAVVEGVVEKDCGTIDLPIARKPGSLIERCVSQDGQRAITHFCTVKRLENMTVLLLKLETGRTHQIRVHLSYIGHPIIGDTLYGKLYGKPNAEINRHALHCSEMSFLHPYTGKRVFFKAPLPQDMENLIVKQQK
ncbi:23S rRNA pseudouridine1911/1915/1917 synthase [Caldanaerobius fijiensis DSM 17918]|uniref:Pseudouridine synthase n=1 Tax=Caldanaerobius fijiensis DSM 17918 TaxID=1121256 RepID=A0A1M4WB97_9THEO|nr:RluA family pseudouridine synthase [Caldanaerobius fijiensis]SHE78363.1 23S rRNA pseudouridine1911/1915/1917 synthase [Caldanaerobius fijiensis DSM 17918]